MAEPKPIVSDPRTVARADVVGARLARALMQEGRLTDIALQQILAAPADEQAVPGWFLVRDGVIEDVEWVERVAAHFGLASGSISDFRIDRELVYQIPEDIAVRYRLLPMVTAGAEVYVATANPTALDAFDHVAGLLRKSVRPLVVSPTELDAALARYYIDEDISDLETFQTKDLNLSAQELARLKDDGESDQVIETVDRILAHAVGTGASDIHIEPFQDGMQVRFRVDGLLRMGPTFPPSMAPPIASRIKVLAQLDIAERYVPQDGRVRMRKTGREIDLRISVVPVTHGEKVVIRLLGQSSIERSLDDLGFDGHILTSMREEMQRPHGMVLVTGPTGSGKSTTLYAALRERMDPTVNIVTVEDPVEYQVRGLNQMPVNRKRGITFALALRAILRQDPDVILVGEIRDSETGVTAAEAAVTGHLLLSTLHTNDAPSAIHRLLELGVPRHLVAPSVNAVLAQRLMRNVCDQCREPYEATDQELAGLVPDGSIGRATLVRATGCPECDETGYRGRTLICELMLVDEDLRGVIGGGATTMEIAAAARAAGMVDMESQALELVFSGQTTTAELARVVGRSHRRKP